MKTSIDHKASHRHTVIRGDIPDWAFENDEDYRPLNVIADRMGDLAAHIHPPVPNPAPLGLIAFGFTTALVMIKHSRIGGAEAAEMKGVDTVTMGFELFFGGLLQVRMYYGVS